MSRGGRIPINIPENTQVRVENGILFAKGKLGELSYAFNKDAKVEVDDNNVIVSKGGNSKLHSQMWGTVRSRIFRGREIIDDAIKEYRNGHLASHAEIKS